MPTPSAAPPFTSNTGVRRTPIELAVLDMAGTTVDEHGSVREAVLSAVEHITNGQSPEDFDAIFTRWRGGAKTAMFEAILGDSRQAIAAHDYFETELERLIRSGRVVPVDGTVEVFEKLRDRKVKIALATGFSAHLREILLDYLGWRNLVDLVLSPTDVGRGRPYPDTVLTAILKTQADSVQAVAVVGDTINDLLCGTRAGAGVVAGVLTGAHDRTQLEHAPHTHILDTITDFPAAIT